MGLAELQADNEKRETATGAEALRAENEKPPLTTAQKIVRGSAGSTIGGALGGAGGAIAGSVVPGIGTVTGAVGGTMIGSGAGEAVTQFFDPLGSGVESPSLTQIGLAAVIPLVPAAARRFFMSLPGAAAGLQQFLFRQLGDKGERIVAKFAPVPGTADDLFKEARAAGAGIEVPMPSTTSAARAIAKEVEKSEFATSGSRALAARAQRFTEQGVASFEEFRLNQSDVGALIRSLERKAGPALGRAKLLYAAMWDDLDSALLQPIPVKAAARGPVAALPPVGGTSPASFADPGRFVARELTQREGVSQTLEAASAAVRGEQFRGVSSAVSRETGPSAAGRVLRVAEEAAPAATELAVSPAQQTLRAAIDAFKREEAAKFVKDWWIGSTMRRVGQKNLDVDTVLTKIDRNRDTLAKLMPEGEIDDMITTLKTFTNIPTMAKTPRLGFESMPFSQRVVVGAAVGGLAGVATGGMTGGSVGAVGGVLAVEAISSALTTAPGRMLVRTLAQRGLALNQIGNMLLQGGRSAFSPDDEVRLNRVGERGMFK